MTTVQANGVPFDVTEAGAGEPPILFVHGLACDATAWAPQIADLSRDHRVAAVNLRGRGATPALPPFGLGQQADDLAAIIEALGMQGAIVVGHSLGGIAALLLNERRPDLVFGVVLGDSPVSGRGLDGTALASAVRNAASTEPAKAMIDRFWTEATPPDVRDAATRMMLGCPPDVLAGMLEQPVSAEHMLEMVRLADRKPFMAMWAERPLGDPAWLRDHTMFVRQEPIAGAGHFFQLEQPALTNALIRAFLEEAARDPRVGS
jgi:pimeloyl-ACP methyl ester carboxylesterase